MSRVSRRAGTKVLRCQDCLRATKGKHSENVGVFRGKSKARLQTHIQVVHRNPRTTKPEDDSAHGRS